MKFTRTFVDPPELQILEKQVDDTSIVVADWRRSIAAIDTQINNTNAALLRAKKQREVHALAASLGDATAIAEIKHARSEQNTAEQSLGDLQIALPEAQAQLAVAEKAAEGARHQLAKLHGEKIMRQRVVAAGRMDAAFAEAASAYNDFERLGRELQAFPDLNLSQGGTMSFYEGATGFRRIAASLPTFFLKLFPTSWSNSDPRRPLAESEQHFWQLPPEQPEAKAA
jgi:uncharacterized membrane protein YccC